MILVIDKALDILECISLEPEIPHRPGAEEIIVSLNKNCVQ